ncbi:MAG: hypothetical protein QOI31_920 [Solirubrobacterales bacterium]|jgi:hypothetical protein|nr:hypothetical protein [Solirubrobacterales bacterium]
MTQVEGWVPIFFLMVVLKIPVGLLLYLVWWAFHAETEPEEAPESGAEEHRFGRFRRQPKRPRGPRRGGPHPDALPLPGDGHETRRTRTVTPRTSRRVSA